MLSGNQPSVETYVHTFQLRLRRLCFCPHFAADNIALWEPKISEKLLDDPLQLRNTIKLILEAIHDEVESQTSPHVRRRGRWLKCIWASKLQREVGGLVLDYHEPRSLTEMECVPYVYIPLVYEGHIRNLLSEDTIAEDGVPCADDTYEQATQMIRSHDDILNRLIARFQAGPSDTWPWN